MCQVALIHAVVMVKRKATLSLLMFVLLVEFVLLRQTCQWVEQRVECVVHEV